MSQQKTVQIGVRLSRVIHLQVSKYCNMSLSERFHGRSLVLLILICLIGLVVGALIGVGIYAAAGCKEEKNGASVAKISSPKDKERERFSWHKKLLDEMQPGNIKRQLQ